MTVVSNLTPLDLGLPPKFSSFWPWQEKAILHLATSDPRFSLVSAPPGSGKSLLSIATALLRGDRVLYLTSTRGLEDQIYRDFSPCGLFDIRGHSNYPCASTSYDEDGELSDLSCLGRQRQGECQYYEAVETANSSQLVQSNYAHWIMLQRADDPNRLGHFDLLICDEAHNADSVLSSCLSIKIRARTIHDYLSLSLPAKDSPISHWIDWGKQAITIARRQYSDISRTNPNGPNDSRLPLLTKLGRDLARFIDHSEHTPWISEEIAATVYRSGGTRTVILSPVWGRDYAEEYLFRGIPRVILMSGTLTPDTGKYLSIPSDPEISEFYEIPSFFPPERRPIIYLPARIGNSSIRVQHNMSEAETRIWMNHIDNILTSRPNAKSIIHALSYKRARDIVSRSRLSEFMLSHGSGDARECVERFMQPYEAPRYRIGRAESERANYHHAPILVSPSVEEGYDFANDLCRLQIIPKIPFIDTRGPLMQARLKDDRSYGDYLTGQRIIQIAGRPVRNMLDWAETVICDAHWAWFRNKTRFARWFRRAWRNETRMPKAPNF